MVFSDSDLCDLHRRDVLSGECLACTYLGAGEEPLYDEDARKQHVHSLNMHEVLSADECDERLGSNASYDAEERALAHAYHSWPPCEATDALRMASTNLRHALTSCVCAPLLSVFALLLGLEEDWVANRCSMRRSDNTSLLRCLEYPRVDAADADGAWGVSVHTDFECFSLLHEDTPGLELCAPDGTWHLPAEAASAADASWILIVGDMVEILSSGYILATPHRVRPTRAVANAPRRSLVFFQALDENEALAPLSGEAAHRSPTGGFRRWWDEKREEENARGRRRERGLLASVTGPITQREWTELKDGAGRERLRERAQAENNNND